MGEARVHEAARAGYGRAAGAYARARPSYPAAAVDWLLDGLGADGPIVEIGAGTGKPRAVVASQSLHWADVDRAFAELDRVLAPDGTIGLVWNFRDVEVAWQRDLDALLAGLRGDAPHSRDGRWERAAGASPFRTSDRASWRWELATDPAGVVERVRSVSYVAARPEEEQLRIDDEVRALVARHGLDPVRVAFPYVTEAYLLRR